MKLTEEAVRKALSTVIDPELQIDIVSLGLIYNVAIDGASRVKIRMTLTTPGCPLAPVIDQMVREALFGLVEDTERDVTIDLTFDPPWIPDMMAEEARLELGL
jgi:metal-sulfur cluster biosynthetic enzyme